MPGRGTHEHVWRVFEGEKEYLVKNFKLNVSSESEKEANSEDWNVVCYGLLCFIVANPIFGFMQKDTVKYIGTSFGCVFAFLLMFLFAGKFGLISRFSEAHDNQIIIIAFLVFYTVLTIISVLMKAFYRFTQ